MKLHPALNLARHMRRSDRPFTLLEILIVIAIIGILTSLLLGGIGFVQGYQRETEARKFMKSVCAAVESASADVGGVMWPEGAGRIIDPNLGGSGLLNYKRFFSMLSYSNYGDEPGLRDDNPRKQAYMTSGLPEDFATRGFEGLKDPWGNYYVLVYDKNFNLPDYGEIRARQTDRFMPTEFGMISYGPDMKLDNRTWTDYKEFKYYYDSDDGDITSWERPKKENIRK